MGSLVARKLLYLFLFQAYCGFLEDAFIFISIGSITSFSSNRHDPRFIVVDPITTASVVCAINYNTLWMLKNVTGAGYLKVW